MIWLHHVLNHFPLALSALAAVAVLAARFRTSERLGAASRWLVYLTAATAVPAALTGLLSAGHFVERGGDPMRMALHRNWALLATTLFVVAAALIALAEKRGHRLMATLGTAGTVAAAGAATLAGHFGGDMLHPGLAPWSSEPHDHGSAEAMAAASAAHQGAADEAPVLPRAEPLPEAATSGSATGSPAPSGLAPSIAAPRSERTRAPRARAPTPPPVSPPPVSAPPAVPPPVHGEHSGH